jgi:hypothetical protein
MTEQEWLECTDPQKMLEFLHRKKSRRKQRLFACACCRLIWDEMPVEWCRAIEVNERFADGTATKEELQKAAAAGSRYVGYVRSAQAPSFACDTTHSSHLMTWNVAAHVADTDRSIHKNERAQSREADFLRDIFVPFRKLKPLPRAWRTSTVTAVARAIYEDRRFADLPILADALEEAGCSDADILAHLRSGGDHVRGCWPLDLVLEKQ